MLEIPQGPVVQEQDTATIVQKELEQIEGFKAIYGKTHRAVEKKEVSFIKSLGIEALIFAIAAIGAAILAAVRTGSIFYIAEAMLVKLYVIESPLISNLPGISLISALLAVEGYLLARGMRDGRKSGKTETSFWGIAFAFAISVLAGIISSMAIIDTETLSSPFYQAMNDLFYILLTLASGVGATVLAYFGAHNLGVIRNEWQKIVQDNENEYHNAEEEWYSKMQASYNGKGGTRVFGKTAASVEEEKKEEEKHQKVQELVIAYLEENGITAYDVGPKTSGALITPKELADKIGFKDSAPVRVVLHRLKSNVTQTKE